MSDFGKTVVNFIIWIAVAVALGCVLGDSVRVMFGTNEEALLMSSFEDRMGVVKDEFAREAACYQMVAAEIKDSDGLMLMRRADGTPIAFGTDGYSNIEDFVSAEELSPELLENIYGAESSMSAEEWDALTKSPLEAALRIFEGSPELSQQQDSTGAPISDVMLYNIEVKDGEVIFYLYYHDKGYVSVLYSEKSLEGRMDVIDLIPNWGLAYDMAQ